MARNKESLNIAIFGDSIVFDNQRTLTWRRFDAPTFTMKNNLKQLTGKKILFATTALEGHFNPLTGLAKYLQEEEGCDVRWFTSALFSKKLEKLKIPHFEFRHTKDVTVDSLSAIRDQINDPMDKLNFDFINFFIDRCPEYFADITEIVSSFNFDVLITELGFTGSPLVRHVLNKPVIMIGIAPLPADSADLAPDGMGLPPAKDEATRAQYAQMNADAVNILFKNTVDRHSEILNEFNLEHKPSLFTHLQVRSATLYLQIGSPGFDYQRSDLGENVRFIGSLLPYQPVSEHNQPWFDERLNQYEHVILVTQGTVESDSSKLIIPTLEAFKDTDVLVIVATAGSNTEELRSKYGAVNVIIEDYIPFNEVFPDVNIYVTNGGYGGTLLSINCKVPMVAAGVHEGKIETCARIGHFNYGINLHTETPDAEAIRNAVMEILKNDSYKANVARLCEELKSYDSLNLCANYIAEIIDQAERQRNGTLTKV